MPSLVDSFGLTAWLDALPGYNSSLGVDQLLELSRNLVESKNYYWRGCAFPGRANTLFGPFQTFEDQFSVDPGSWLTIINSYYSAPGAGQLPADQSGFKLQLYDAGAKTPLLIRSFAQHGTISGEMALATPGGTVQPYFGPGFLQSPLVICEPGQITAQITNLAAVQAEIQLLLVFAVPVTRVSLNQREVMQRAS